MKIEEDIGSKIKYFRKLKKMSLDELALAISKSKPTLSKYENGKIIIDILTLYDIADALDIDITQLLYTKPKKILLSPEHFVPGFFQNLSQFFMYYYDGRINQTIPCVCDILQPLETNVYKVMLYMNFQDFDHYKTCENTYCGKLKHFDALSSIILENQDVEMDHYQISIPMPSLNLPTKWGLSYGISSRPLMPTAAKTLISKTLLEITPQLQQDLKISKEDIRLLKLYNMLIVF